MKTKPNVGDKCFYWDNDGEKVTAIIQSIDADGIVNFGDDMALHWRALHGRVVKKNKMCEECVDLRDELNKLLGAYHERVSELEKQLSGERFWVGHNRYEKDGAGSLRNDRVDIPSSWDYHTEVLVLQTKKSSDT